MTELTKISGEVTTNLRKSLEILKFGTYDKGKTNLGKT